MTTIDPAIAQEPIPFVAGELSAQSLYDKCWTLARNLWWTWHPEVINLFRDLDPIRWRQLDHNPVALLREFTAERLAQRAAEMVLYSRINYAHRRLKEYMANRQTWAAWNAGVLGSKPVDPDLFRRSRCAVGRSHQKCQRFGREPCGYRPVLRSGLFQAAA